MGEMVTEDNSRKQRFTDELINEVKSMLKESARSLFSDQQITDACKQVSEGVGEAELVALLKIQSSMCDRCAACCKTYPNIDLTTEEIFKIAKYKGMSPAKTMKKFKIAPTGTRLHSSDGNGLILYHMKGNPCPFFAEPNVCTIYDVRPGACAGYPALGMINDVIKGKGVPFLDTCHIIKKWQAHRAIVSLMRKNNPELEKLAEDFHLQLEQDDVIKKLRNQLDNEQNPEMRIILQYQLGQRMSQLVGGDEWGASLLSS